MVLSNVVEYGRFSTQLFELGTCTHLFLALVAYGAWRIWRFTVRPRLYPLVPRELPYWIPFLGHAIGFFRCVDDVLNAAKIYFRHSREPFTVIVGGKSIHVVTDGVDVDFCLRNTTEISFAPIAKELWKRTLVSEEGVRKMTTVDPSAKYNQDLPAKVTLHGMIIHNIRLQALPGKHFDELMHGKMEAGILRSLDFFAATTTSNNNPAILQKGEKEVVVSVKALSEQIFIREMTEAFHGKAIWAVAPDLAETFEKWEDTNWKYLFGLPACLSRDMLQARERLVDAFKRYFRLKREHRRDACFFVEAMEDVLVDTGLSEDDRARVFAMHYWAVQGNVYRVTFWIIAYIAYDRELLEALRTEALPYFKAGGILDEPAYAKNCPKFDSLMAEVLRLIINSGLLREVVAPVQIGGKLLDAGSQILVPFRQLHLDNDIWGDDSLSLNPSRFEFNKKLKHSAHYHPFGGGHSLCPGRVLAKRATGFAVASLLCKYDVALLPRTREAWNSELESQPVPAFPRMDSSKPSPGAMLPHKDDDVILRLQKRGL